MPMQVRTSDDGVCWSHWRPLLREKDDVEKAEYCQVRVLIGGTWETSPVFVWEAR